MIAVGVDLVEVPRFAAALAQRPRLASRVFTDAERAQCGSRTERLAARFAAKEAAFKALGDGWPAVAYHEVEIASDASGAPRLVLRGRAAELAGRRACSVSLSHTPSLAMAQVVLDG